MSFTLLGIMQQQAAGGGAGIPAFDLLQTTILTTTTTSVSFTGLDTYTDYKHLQIRLTVRGDHAASDRDLFMRMNGDSSSSYTRHNLSGSGASVSSLASVSQTSIKNPGIVPAATQISNVFAAGVFDILDFSSTQKNTTIRNLIGTDVRAIELTSGLYLSTSAITSITYLLETGNFVAGSRFSLYGIKGA